MARLTKADKKRAASSRNLEDHILGETTTVEKGAIGAPVQDVPWDVKKAEVHSDVTLEQDTGEGNAVIVRSFDFKANPEAFIKQPPSTQELFNAHLGQIEVFLLKDGLKLFQGVNPRVMISKNKKFYRIIVGAEPRTGWSLDQTPQTLSQLAHGNLGS
jgi:hypothetical protein